MAGRLHIEMEPLQPIKLGLVDLNREYPAQLLDKNDDTLIVRVPDALKAREAPDRIVLFVGYRNVNWRAETDVHAHFEDWWFLRRPRETEFISAQRRQHVRIVFKEDLLAIPVDTRGLPTDSPLEAKVRNLSATGCFAYLKRTMKEGDRVMIVLSLPDMPVISPISRVIRVQKLLEDGAGWYGFMFENLTQAQEEALAKYIHALIMTSMKAGLDITAD